MSSRLQSGIISVTVMIVLLPLQSLQSQETAAKNLFSRKNLVAWCIVPFDSKKRGPEERAAMLEKLGFSRFAYDYRTEHIPTFDAEIEALQRHHVELTAWWFPTTLNDEAKMTLEVFARHKVTPQLWVTGGGGPTTDDADQRHRVVAEAARIRPIAEAAARVGCKVALYNHGGWFGEPENQIAIIHELKLANVGIVYNQHHGHDHIDRFPELLQKMKPHLLALNLNGMVKEGDRKGQKILQLGQGDLDLKLIKVIQQSGYTGLIGILGHTEDDAQERLQDNLDGLDWLLPQLDGKPAGPKPKTRTPVPRAVAVAPAPAATNKPLVDGKFGEALDGRAGGALVIARDTFRQFPITVECWAKLSDKGTYNILVASEMKSSGTHWELFSMTGTGHFTVYLPGFAPDHCHSSAMICDNQWHYVVMTLEPQRVRLFVDGKQVADQPHKRTERASEPGALSLGSLVDRAIGCSGLLDEVRISKGIRRIESMPDKPFDSDEATVALWHLDEMSDQKRLDDASPGKNAAVLGAVPAPEPVKDVAKSGKIEGHWGEDAIGFRWTEADSRDDRFGQMDTGPFFSGSITGPGGPVYKGIVVRLGDKRQASICYDTELLRVSAGWNGFLKLDPARLGIIVPPKIEGDALFVTPRYPGWSRQEQFDNYRGANPYGPLPRDVAHYQGLYRHGQRVVLKYVVGLSSDGRSATPSECTVLESPWLEERNGIAAITRTLLVGPAAVPLRMIVADTKAQVHLQVPLDAASLVEQPGIGRVLVIAPHRDPFSIKLLLAAAGSDSSAFQQLAADSPKPEDLAALTQPGPTIWGEPLVTRGELGKDATAPYVVDTITLPFENRFNALFFCGGHDFLRDGRAAVCTLHGDVWIVDGIDPKLERITWRRFATGLFQPLGLKYRLQPLSKEDNTPRSVLDSVFVVGRDQITRLHDLNGDGEADYYENFNNDAHVTLNGHEYVACLETDSGGNFYYVKGNCNSQTPHDGCLLRVHASGSKLDVFATGFRNPNGMGMGPNDEITVAPQEGEWTPASGVFLIHQGGFYGGMMSHHRPTPPTDFERPLVWFPRLADNSSGGQVWTTDGRWGPLSNQLLHLSYGQCRLRLVLQDVAIPNNGCSIELPLRFNSGIHRGRMNPRDGQLYLTGLKGWTTSGVHDGCFQRVRYTGQPMDIPVTLKTYGNGIALTFSREIDRETAEDPSNYQLESWNYKWSSAYGSPEYRPSAPVQTGRDEVEARSATLLRDHRTVFLELPDLKPVDQLAVNYTLLSKDRQPIEQSAILTLNGISTNALPEQYLHRKSGDDSQSDLLSRLEPGVMILESPVPSDRPESGRFISSQRLAAWMRNEQSADRIAHRQVEVHGYLRVPRTGRYRLFDGGAPSTETRIKIDDQSGSLKEGLDVALRRGVHPFVVTGASRTHFRLMWSSNRFPPESIPASQLLHQPPDPHAIDVISEVARVSGIKTFQEFRCGNCHQEPGFSSLPLQSDQQELTQASRRAPRLEGIGSRLNSAWLAQWIRDPHLLRNDTQMPGVIAPDDVGTADDIVAYLTSLHEPDANTGSIPEPDAAAAESLATEGADLFERLGCIACHSFGKPDAGDTWNRVTLHFANAKYRPQALFKYLLSPHAHHPDSRMPDYRLTQSEAVSLVQYVRKEAKGQLEKSNLVSRGDVERGRIAFGKKRCANCHVTERAGQLAKPDVAPVRGQQAPIIGKSIPETACLARTGQPGAKAPWFHFQAADRASLIQFCSIPLADRQHLRSPTAKLSVGEWMKHLRCNACHARDASPSLWPEIVAEEGSGRQVESVPQLTWVGEKLQGPWIENLLKGELKQKPRPWLTARMPGFPAYAGILAHGMAAEHGVAFEEALPEQDHDRVEIGRQLTLRDGGLDCRQCHGVGKELPRGDKSTQIALGINFAMTKERLRPEFALRQILDPPRYDIGSRMPRFAPDLRTTAAKHVEGGDAVTQFEALKQFIWSVEDK